MSDGCPSNKKRKMDIPKTPVSILQEMMLKKFIAPSYDLVESGSGSHQNVFTYEVSCDGLTARGSGRSKKDAKHEAASAMLAKISENSALLQLPGTPHDSPVRTPLPIKLPVRPKSPLNVPFHNFVGELQELCSSNNLQDPVYKEVNDIGPPHARIFTTQCIVSTFTEVGEATTKKQAKHDAARKMIDKIKDIVVIDTIPNEDLQKEDIANQRALEKYPQVSKVHESIKTKINFGYKIIDLYRKFKDKFNEESKSLFIEKINILKSDYFDDKNNSSEDQLEALMDHFKNILASINLSYVEIVLDANQPNVYLVMIQVSSDPVIVEIGQGFSLSKARFNSIKNTINTIECLLK